MIKVLYIEDNLADQELMRSYLEKSYPGNWQLELAETGAQGLAKMGQLDFQIVLLDYRLPDLSGLEILGRINGLTGKKPAVIFITGLGSEMVAVEALKGGAYDYLVKDHLNAEKLKQSLGQALEKKALVEKQKMAGYRELLARPAAAGLDAEGGCSLITKEEYPVEALLSQLQTSVQKKNRPLMYVSYHETAKTVQQHLESAGFADYLIIDVTQAIPFDEGSSDKRVRSLSPAALDGLDSQMNSLLLSSPLDQPPIFILDSINIPIVFSEFAPSYRFFHRLLGRIKSSRASLIAYYDPKALPEIQINSIKNLFAC